MYYKLDFGKIYWGNGFNEFKRDKIEQLENCSVENCIWCGQIKFLDNLSDEDNYIEINCTTGFVKN